MSEPCEICGRKEDVHEACIDGEAIDLCCPCGFEIGVSMFRNTPNAFGHWAHPVLMLCPPPMPNEARR